MCESVLTSHPVLYTALSQNAIWLQMYCIWVRVLTALPCRKRMSLRASIVNECHIHHRSEKFLCLLIETICMHGSKYARRVLKSRMALFLPHSKVVGQRSRGHHLRRPRKCSLLFKSPHYVCCVWNVWRGSRRSCLSMPSPKAHIYLRYLFCSDERR